MGIVKSSKLNPDGTLEVIYTSATDTTMIFKKQELLNEIIRLQSQLAEINSILALFP